MPEERVCARTSPRPAAPEITNTGTWGHTPPCDSVQGGNFCGRNETFTASDSSLPERPAGGAMGVDVRAVG